MPPYQNSQPLWIGAMIADMDDGMKALQKHRPHPDLPSPMSPPHVLIHYKPQASDLCEYAPLFSRALYVKVQELFYDDDFEAVTVRMVFPDGTPVPSTEDSVVPHLLISHSRDLKPFEVNERLASGKGKSIGDITLSGGVGCMMAFPDGSTAPIFDQNMLTVPHERFLYEHLKKAREDLETERKQSLIAVHRATSESEEWKRRETLAQKSVQLHEHRARAEARARDEMNHRLAELEASFETAARNSQKAESLAERRVAQAESEVKALREQLETLRSEAVSKEAAAAAAAPSPQLATPSKGHRKKRKGKKSGSPTAVIESPSPSDDLLLEAAMRVAASEARAAVEVSDASTQTSVRMDIFEHGADFSPKDLEIDQWERAEVEKVSRIGAETRCDVLVSVVGKMRDRVSSQQLRVDMAESRARIAEVKVQQTAHLVDMKAGELYFLKRLLWQTRSTALIAVLRRKGLSSNSADLVEGFVGFADQLSVQRMLMDHTQSALKRLERAQAATPR